MSGETACSPSPSTPSIPLLRPPARQLCAGRAELDSHPRRRQPACAEARNASREAVHTPQQPHRSHRCGPACRPSPRRSKISRGGPSASDAAAAAAAHGECRAIARRMLVYARPSRALARGSALRIDLPSRTIPCLRPGEMDLRIIYGSAAYEGLAQEPLFLDVVRPLCRAGSGGAVPLPPCRTSPVHPYQLGAGFRLASLLERLVRAVTCPARRIDPAKGHRVGSSLPPSPSRGRARHRTRPAAARGRTGLATGELVALDAQIAAAWDMTIAPCSPARQGAQSRAVAAFDCLRTRSAASVIASHTSSAKVRIT